MRGLYGTPLVMIGSMWTELLAWATTHMRGTRVPLADAVDLGIPRCVDDVDAAVAIVRGYRARWLEEGPRDAEPSRST